MWKTILWSVVILVVCLAAITLVSWIIVSKTMFAKFVKPGEGYKVGNRAYTIPNLPHKTYGSAEKASHSNAVPVLPEQTLIDLHTLVKSTFVCIRKMDVSFWVTGGTLISAVLWHFLMPYDDDADVSFLWRDRAKIWNKEFLQHLEHAGLEAFVLRGVSRDYAPTRESSCLRIRKKGTYYPVVDLFFLDWDDEQQRWAHVNGWSGDRVWFDNTTEVWKKDWLFPLQDVDVDGMKWPIPAKPELMLTKHYGAEWKTTIQSPRPMFNSHKWAFYYSNIVRAWTVLSP